MRACFHVAAALFSVLFWCGDVRAAGFFVGSISASIENPRFNGSFGDNTSTAIYNIYGGGSTASINWGTNAGQGPGMSIFHFFANQSISVLNDQPFELGKITFFNGTSQLNSLIYGFDLVLDFIPAAGFPEVDTMRLGVSIGTTFNTGVTQSGDADYVNLAGLPNALWVWESFGGTGSVSGSIVGDPYFELQDLVPIDEITIFTDPDPNRMDAYVYNPDDFTTLTGTGLGLIVGFAAPPVPEPSSAVLMGVGSLCIVAVLRRRKKA
ncbi:MAG: choice-of-anchor K domain-containing protein [Planctomycetaceae bacterium]